MIRRAYQTLDAVTGQLNLESSSVSDQGEVDWTLFFKTLAEVGFDGIMTACVFAWEERADQSSRFMRQEMGRYIDMHWK